MFADQQLSKLVGPILHDANDFSIEPIRATDGADIQAQFCIWLI